MARIILALQILFGFVHFDVEATPGVQHDAEAWNQRAVFSTSTGNSTTDEAQCICVGEGVCKSKYSGRPRYCTDVHGCFAGNPLAAFNHPTNHHTRKQLRPL